MREHDFIPRTKLASNRAADGKSQRSHVRTENEFIRITAQEVRHRGTRARDYSVRAAAGRIGTASIGVAALQIIRDRVDDTLRNLSSARPIEERCRMSVDDLGERWELGANPIQIESICCFVLSAQHRIHKDFSVET